MTVPTDLAFARFARDWGAAFIEKWARKATGRGSHADTEDLRQAANEAAWKAFLAWQAMPDDQRTDTHLKALVGSSVQDALKKERRTLFDARARGVRASLLREYVRGVVTTRSGASAGAGYAADRLEATSRTLTALHLLVYGLSVHAAGSVPPELALMRDEARERLRFAIDRLDQLDPRAAALVEGYYFHGRRLKDIGAELGIGSASALTRLHHAALDVLRKEMEEFASLLAARNAATLDDEPVLR